MKIYNRDFSAITDAEQNDWDSIKKREETTNSKGGTSLIKKNLFREYPKAVKHFLSLFPNNYLDIEDLKNEIHLNDLIEQFKLLLNNSATIERSILDFIKNKEAYFIIGSLMASFNFGHHDAYIIPEFILGISHKVDYLLIGKNSGGYQFVFVELESPYGRITVKDGNLGESLRKGIKQLDDWEIWLESNFSSLVETFQKYVHPNKELTKEFTRLDKTRFNYLIVGGRREDFNDLTYRIKRKMKEDKNITLLHYDNLYDSAINIVGKPSY